jgi:hypothetical protein
MTGTDKAARSLGFTSAEFSDAERRDREAFASLDPKLAPVYRAAQRIVVAVNTMDGRAGDGLVDRAKAGDKEATYSLAGYAHRVIAAVESFAAAFYPDAPPSEGERRTVEFVQSAADWLAARGLEGLRTAMALAMTRADLRHGAGLALQRAEAEAAKQGGRR